MSRSLVSCRGIHAINTHIDRTQSVLNAMSINWLEIVVDKIDMHQNDLLMKFHQSSQANEQTNESNEICDELNLSF